MPIARIVTTAVATCLASGALAGTALAGPPTPPGPIECTDACLIDPAYPTTLKGYVGEVRDWATSPPPVPPLATCPDACTVDPKIAAARLKVWAGEVVTWLAP